MISDDAFASMVAEEVKNKLYEEGAFYAAMSGSGSTMFGLYHKKPEDSFEKFAPSLEKIVVL